jgi:hypothetical protein
MIRCRYADLFTPDHLKKALAPPMPQPALGPLAPPPLLFPLIGTVIAVPFVPRHFNDSPVSP